ncbi:MAG: hypothetical protein ACTSPL_08280 [Candidatus Odinarchaeia archaeon]
MNKTEKTAVTATVLVALAVTAGLFTYTMLTLPSPEGVVAISTLDQNHSASGLIEVENGSSFYFYCMVENHLGHSGYFMIEVWKGEIISDINPPLENCSLWGNLSRIVMNDQSYEFKISDTLYTNNTSTRYIYYMRLYTYSVENSTFQYTDQWVAMQVNVTA